MPKNRQERQQQQTSLQHSFRCDDDAEEAYFGSFAADPPPPPPAPAAAVEPPAAAIAFRPRQRSNGVPTTVARSSPRKAEKKLYVGGQHNNSSTRSLAAARKNTTTTTTSSQRSLPQAVEPRLPPARISQQSHSSSIKYKMANTPSTDYAAAAAPLPSSSRNVYNNDDEDLIAQKMPRARRERGPAGRGGGTQFSSNTLRYNSVSTLNTTTSSRTVQRRSHNKNNNNNQYHHAAADEQDLTREKLPLARPANFTPTPPTSNSRKKAVKASKVEIVPDPTTDQPLQWETAQAFAAPSVPVADLAEPSSAGALMMMDSSSREGGLAISQSHVLPAGRDAASSYHNINNNNNMPMINMDEPTRTAEATVLSYCTVPSYEVRHDAVAAQAIGMTNKHCADYRTNGDGKKSSAKQQPNKGYVNGYELSQQGKNKNDKSNEKGGLAPALAPTCSREAQKVQLEMDLQARQHQQASVVRQSDAQRQAQKMRQHPQPPPPSSSASSSSSSSSSRRPIVVVKKMAARLEDDTTSTSRAEDSESQTVPHRNHGETMMMMIRQVPPAKASLEPTVEAPPQGKKCCLWAILGG